MRGEGGGFGQHRNEAQYQMWTTTGGKNRIY